MNEKNNISIYEKVRAVPSIAKKEIKGGRLKGKTDINPMWRIKALTENFGVCGFGWKTVLKRFWLENGNNGVVSAFCEIELYVKIDNEWGEAIPGIGGSAFVDKESSGLHTSDECYKMAYTDAISVACKALGFGADVYWDSDKTKYNKNEQSAPLAPKPTVELSSQSNKPTAEQLEELQKLADIKEVAVYLKVEVEDLTAEQVRWAINRKKLKKDGKSNE